MKQNENSQDSTASLLASICEKFDQELSSGQVVPIENILSDVPAGQRGSLLAGLLPIELKYRRRSGSVPDVEEYLARFPEQRDVIDRIFDDSGTIDNATHSSARKPLSTRDDIDTNTVIARGDEMAAADTISRSSAFDTEGDDRALGTIIPIYPDGKGYIVVSEIDRGGMGVVLKVRDENLQRTLALKVIRGQERAGNVSRARIDQGMLARFIREAQVTGRLDHPGVVPIHELATDEDGRIYFTMKYVQGQTLSKVIPQLNKKSSQWDLPRVLEVLVRVCETLAFAHSKKIIHRDLKPSNIMVGEFGEAYVMDWGLAKVLGEPEEVRSPEVADENGPTPSHSDSRSSPQSHSQTQSQTLLGDVVGTPYFMPPEQAEGKINELDERTDVYSAGAVLYEILTGRSPYKTGKRPSGEIIREVIAGPPKPIRELDRKAPPELVAIAEKAMRRQMQDRYSNVSEMADDLRAYLSQRVVSAYQSGIIARLRKWVIRNQSVTIAGMLTLATIASALGIVSVLQRYNQREIESKNDQLSRSLKAKVEAVLVSEAAAEKEKIARDEVNGLSLMNHSKNAIAQGNAELATLLSLESVARISNSATNETLYAAVAELVNTANLDSTSRCSNLVWSPDDSRLLTIDVDGNGTIWNVETNKVVAAIINTGQSAFSTSVFSRDGRQILTAGAQGAVALWNADTGVRELALAVGQQEPRTANDAQTRPYMIAAAYCADIQTGEREARIVAVSRTGALHLFDRHTGRELAVLIPPSKTGPSQFKTFAVSPDGHTLVVGCEDGNVFVWKDQQQPAKVIDRQKSPIQSIRFSADGKLFTTCGFPEDRDDPAILSPAFCWHTETAELHSEIAPNGLHVCSAEFHPVKSLLAFGLSDRTLCLWDLDQKKVVAISRPQDELIDQLNFSDSGDRIATVTKNNGLTMWVVLTQSNTVSLSASRHLYGHQEKIHRVVHNRSGSRLASAAGTEVRIWNTGFENAVPTFGSPSFTSLVHFSSRGDRIAETNLTEKKTRLWSYPEIKQITEISASSADFYANHFTADGLHFVTSFTDGECRLWDSGTGDLQFKYQCPEMAAYLACSGSRLCIANDAEVTVWDWKTNELLGRIRSPDLQKFRISPDGRVLVVQRQDRVEGRMISIDPASIDLTGNFTISKEIEDSETCNPGAMSSSGRHLWCYGTQHPSYATAASAQIKLIDTQAGQVLFSTQGEDPIVRTVVIDAADTRLLVEYVEGPESTAEIYSIPDGHLIGGIGGPEGEVIGYSADLNFVAIRSIDDDIQLWDTSACAIVRNLGIDRSHRQTICFSPDNKYFAMQHFSKTGDPDEDFGQVSLWGAEQLEMISMVPGENENAFSTTFLPDGARFWTLSAENKIRLWPLDAVASAKKHVARALTINEQRMFGIDKIRCQPIAAPPQRPSRSLNWDRLSERIRLLSPVTAERRRSAVKLMSDVERWLNEEATHEEVTLALRAIELLRSGTYDTDPLVLTEIARLYEKFGARTTSIQILELAARHPRAFELAEKLTLARREIAPAVASLQSADVLADASFAEAATPEDKQALASTRSWAAENSPLIAQYLAARQHQFEGHPELAQPILRRLAETALTSSDPQIGPELFLQLAQCHLALDEAENAANALRSALNVERFRAPDVWNRWLQISFTNLRLSPQQLITQLPEKTEENPPELCYDDSVAWLLSQLSQSLPLRINCGGDQYVSAGETVWASDRFFSQGYGFFGTHGEAAVFAGSIANTKDPLLFQSERWFANPPGAKPAGYQIPLPNGKYEVRLGFAEIYAAERSMDVLLEDRKVLAGYDPANGAWATADEVIALAEVIDGQLDIVFESRNDENTKLSCLQISPIVDDSTAD